jgi:dimethylhistidine N-methyltransferase
MTRYTVLGSGEAEMQREREEFAAEVLIGLTGPSKRLPCRFIYDEEGSRLFKEIMDLPEYYLTRSETEILGANGEAICNLVGEGTLNLLELGAGDGKKTRLLLKSLLEHCDPCLDFVPVDISESAVSELTGNFADEFPSLSIKGIVAEYFDAISWLAGRDSDRNLVLFLGSNIGNFAPSDREVFLLHLRNALDAGDLVLMGFDLKKDTGVIEQAYNDSRGITGRFNFNLLSRINTELGGTFDESKFFFRSGWDPDEDAVQSFLVSRTDQRVYVRELDRAFEFKAWEPIHTESSYKFSSNEVKALAERVGFKRLGEFYDSNRYFLDVLWEVTKD